MPKSKRCSECDLPCRSHNRTAFGTRRKALVVKAKIKKYGRRKPDAGVAQLDRALAF